LYEDTPGRKCQEEIKEVKMKGRKGGKELK
jgi:hypothetical protein